ncbi:MAG: IclR family transcriptional regulator [Chelatococcus sp.]|jgi:IclR family acetate operon transcriptional repressor|uniref:IclR family transcriptional regulator n=1 Tax=Chelatococcus sp. TaxID=1953771 RepID=UPI0025B868C2|nr:IclR family transcriptional regulator [Chelatococcus sp.]MBX3536722.1 IclR family transcriptional regulator [Chelatococcus sp.]
MAVRSLSTVLKTLAVLDAAGRSDRPLRLVDFCRATGEARGAVYQRLVTLIEAGWIEATDEGTYRLSLRIVPYANRALDQASLGTRLADVLQQIVVDTGETASLAVLEDGEAVIVQRVESRGILRSDLRVGKRLELARTALGRALAAYAQPEILAHLAELGVDLPPEEVMREVREQGYSVSVLSGPRTVSAVASPIFDSRGHCIGAISVSGPTAGFDKDKCARAAVAAAERANSRLMGMAAE